MTTDKSLGRSAARAHLSQLIDMFGVDGCLKVNVVPEPAPEAASEAAEEE
ncbi:hypothetical protein OHR86_16070 [Streptomyces sp. NBC_00441]|nr:hypothetical protein [Streptomyces sp. NBC_00441]